MKTIKNIASLIFILSISLKGFSQNYWEMGTDEGGGPILKTNNNVKIGDDGLGYAIDYPSFWLTGDVPNFNFYVYNSYNSAFMNFYGLGTNYSLDYTSGKLTWSSFQGDSYSWYNVYNLMTLTSNKIGIGTTNPQKTLDVSGDINFTGNLYKNGQLFSGGGSSQWTTNGTNIYYSTGNVGIGTTTPGATLSFGNVNDGRNVADGITWYSPDPLSYGIYRTIGPWSSPNYQQLKMNWHTGIVIDGGSTYGKSGTVLQPNGGNVGIGTTTPGEKLDVSGNIKVSGNISASGPIYSTDNGNSTSLRGYGLQGTGNMFIVPAAGSNLYLTDDWSGTGELGIQFGKTVFSTGNVLIGKTSQSNTNYKLDVAGPIRVDEVTVNTTGSDFVFEKNYKLLTLKEVEAYIAQHKHLPDIAPAVLMQAEGVGLGEMQTKLLQKVEELTLYVIEQEKKIDMLKKEVEIFKKK